MIRQFELVERVQSYDPDADEEMLNRAYVYGLKKHGTQLRASGDPYFSHPVEVAGILAEMRLDTASIVTGLLHDTVEDTDATRDEIARPVRRGHRPPGRRRHQAHPPGAAVGEHQAGRELPQAGAGDVVGHPRAAGEARRPPAQHADAALHQGSGAAPAHRARDHGDLCPARRAHRHGEGQERARGAGLRRAQSRRPRLDRWRAWAILREQRRAAGARASRPSWSRRCKDGGLEARGLGAREDALFDLAQDADARTCRSSSSSDIMAFRIIVADIAQTATRRSASLHGRYHGAAAALQGLHLDAQAQRLSLAAHRRDRPARPAHRDADPHRGDAGHGRARRRRALALQAGRAVDRRAAISAGCASLLDILEQGAQRRGVPRAHQARDVPGPGVLLHAQGRADRPAARRHAGRLRLCGAHPGRRHLRRRQDQRPHAAAAHPAAERRPGRDHHLAGADAVAAPGSASSSPARREAAHPPLHPHAPARAVHPARQVAARQDLPRGGLRGHGKGPRRRARQLQAGDHRRSRAPPSAPA